MSSTRAKVYIETTIVSYLTARPGSDLIIAAHQQITRDWWQNRRACFDLFISQAVIEEASAGDPQAAADRLQVLAQIRVLGLNESALQLARALVAKGPLPEKAAVDALHIALATVHGMDYLLNWNCQAHCKCRDASPYSCALPNARIRTTGHLGGALIWSAAARYSATPLWLVIESIANGKRRRGVPCRRTPN